MCNIKTTSKTEIVVYQHIWINFFISGNLFLNKYLNFLHQHQKLPYQYMDYNIYQIRLTKE